MTDMGWGLRQRWKLVKQQISRIYPGLNHKQAGEENLPRQQESDSLKSAELEDLEILNTLGVGAFGRVYLVQLKEKPCCTYALKKMAKTRIVEAKQQAHILSEKAIMSSVNSDFVVRLHKTFKDERYLYMLLDVCLGGELWTILRDKHSFDHPTTRFYTACVLEAFSYLHERDVMYRDLKPENILLDRRGYAKLVDFGFAKESEPTGKTWTICGTTEYMAPEVVLNNAHDTAVDLWALGILVYEMLIGEPPFHTTERLKTYRLILEGFDNWKFPSKLVRSDKDLVRKLCRADPSDRLGYGPGKITDVYNHRWFERFRFESLRARTMKPPIMPTVRDPTDASNFDSYPEVKEDAHADTSGWDDDF